ATKVVCVDDGRHGCLQYSKREPNETTCMSLSTRFSISVLTLIGLNPDLNCSDMTAAEYVCVHAAKPKCELSYTVAGNELPTIGKFVKRFRLPSLDYFYQANPFV